MSMNLVFHDKGGAGSVDFPYQTRTDTTYAVLETDNLEERLRILKEAMAKRFGTEDVDRLLPKIEELLDNPKLELTMV